MVGEKHELRVEGDSYVSMLKKLLMYVGPMYHKCAKL